MPYGPRIVANRDTSQQKRQPCADVTAFTSPVTRHACAPRSTPPGGPPDPEDVFDHLRREDGEHVGYIEMSADGRFIPYDRLWVRRGEVMDLDEAEAVLDAIGLRLPAEDWLLEGEDPQTGEESWARVRIREIHPDLVIVARAVEDLSAGIAKSVDLIDAIELPLPTTRLRSAS